MLLAIERRGGTVEIDSIPDLAQWLGAYQNVFTVNDFRAYGDSLVDWLDAFHRARDELIKLGGGIINAPDKVYPVLDSINLVDLTRPIVLRGGGKYSTILYGNFAGTTKAVVDLGFSDNAKRIASGGLESITVCSNGVIGDPIAVRIDRSQQHSIKYVHVPGDSGEIIQGLPRKHLNSSIVITQGNNFDVTECTFKSGCNFSPYPNSRSTTYSVAVGTTTCEASVDTFSPEMVGEIIIFMDGERGTDQTQYWHTTIASYTDPTHVELTDPAPKDIISERASVGFVTGSMTGTTLTLNQPIAVEEMVGLRICVPYAYTNTDAGNTKALLITTIAGFTDESTLELTNAADTPVTDVPIIFAPSVLVGTPREQIGETRQTNDGNFNFCQFEGGQGGIVVNHAVILHFNSCKLEVESIGSGIAARSPFCMILSETKDVYWDQGAINFGSHPKYGQIWVMGSRGRFTASNIYTTGNLRDQPFIYVDDENTNSFEAHIEELRYNDGLSKHSADYTPQRVPVTHPNAVTIKKVMGRLTTDTSWGNDKLHLGYRSGRYYSDVVGYVPGAPAAAQTADLLYLLPIGIEGPVFISGLLIYVNSSVAGTHALLGVYENCTYGEGAGAYARPGRLLRAGSVVDTSQAPNPYDSALTSNLFIPDKRRVWFGALIDGAANLRAVQASDYKIAAQLGGGTAAQLMASSGQILGNTYAQLYSGGLPSDLTNATLAAIGTATCPYIAWKCA